MSTTIRALVHFIFFYTCIEGLVINVLYPAKLPYVYKDLMILLAYAGIVLPDLSRAFNPPPLARVLGGTLVLFGGLVVVYLLVPTGVSPFSMLVAAKQRLFYIPLLMVAYVFIRSVDDLRWLVGMIAAYAIGVSAFGIYLFLAGPAGLTVLGAGYSAVIFAAETSVRTWRVPGTFTSPGQYGVYLMFSAVAVSALIADREAPRWMRVLGCVSLVTTVLAMLVSGTRTTLVLATGSVALALVMSGRLTRIVTWTAGLYAILACGFATLGPGVRDRVGSIVSIEHLERFERTYFGQLFASPLLENPFGSGLGVATIGARHFSELGQVVLMESYLGILAVELGWPGLLAFLAVASAIVWFVLKHRRTMAASSESTYWMFFASFVIVVVAVLPVNTSIDSAPGNFYFWFTVGIVIRLVELQYWREWQITATVESPAAGVLGPVTVARETTS